MGKHRVLFVDHATAHGGAEHSLLLLLEHLDRTRFAPHLATRPGALAQSARARGIVVHETPLARLRREPTAPIRLLRGALALTRIIARERITSVQSNTMRAGLYAAVAARLTRRPFVWHVRDLVPRGAYSCLLCRCADAVIAVSEGVAASLPCRERVRVIPNGVRLEDFRADLRLQARELRRTWGVPDDAALVGQVARLQAWKGQMAVIESAALVLKHLPDTRFVLVGGDVFGDAGTYEQELRAAIDRLGLSGRVILAGQRTDVPVVLAALDVLVHASRDEPFGRILIEGAAAGVPVVAFGGGGVPEIVAHERTGLLVRPGDTGALADGVCRLLSDPALARSLAERARALAAERFDVRSVTGQIESVFEEVSCDT